MQHRFAADILKEKFNIIAYKNSKFSISKECELAYVNDFHEDPLYDDE